MCVHVCVCVRACVRMGVCACVRAHARVWVWVCLCACVRACVSMCACACVRACMRACVRVRRVDPNPILAQATDAWLDDQLALGLQRKECAGAIIYIYI